MWRCSKKMAICRARRGLRRVQTCWHLPLGFQPPKYEKMSFCHLSNSVCGIFLWQPKKSNFLSWKSDKNSRKLGWENTCEIPLSIMKYTKNRRRHYLLIGIITHFHTKGMFTDGKCLTEESLKKNLKYWFMFIWLTLSQLLPVFWALLSGILGDKFLVQG